MIKTINRLVKGLILTVSISLIYPSCYKEEIIDEIDEVAPGEGLPDWTSETHSSDASPDYNLVFPQDMVNRIDLIIDSIDWQIMLGNLTRNIGPFGSGRGMSKSPEFTSFGYDRPPPPVFITPVFVTCSFFFEGREWYNVGVRFKGNSSLNFAWLAGIMKLALRFDFDEFEDEYPEINDQRFYGFHKLSFSSNFNDPSFLHEKITADIFRDAGLKAPRTAYYRVYIDYGEGPVYFGLYTAVEIVEDTMLDDQFGSSTGNCYKPEGRGGTFAFGTFNTTDFDLKTNEDIADYSDIEALYNILHSNIRNSDVEQWRSELESVFDTDHFMKWLATNTVIQSWDTYGTIGHNYYLYNNPYTNKLVWIPWDNNQALTSRGREPLSLSMTEVESRWPLIRYLMDQPEYEAIYETYLQSVIDDAFEPSKMKELYQYYHNLIYDYVIGSDGEQPGYTFLRSLSVFTDALSYQMNHVDERHNAVINYLSK
ncbi:MAG: CotH kinase family protein [Bacteroidales bacterium]|nr:CotH kinase family protein [Bacteroidales bacterium]